MTLAFTSGRYSFTPFVNTHPQAGFIARLSIRSGQGVSSHDRVLTFSPHFGTEASALRYAFEQARLWLGARAGSIH
ncbi:hypothetical protein D8I35_15445 [Corticibacter populi]|uniref:DUF1488 family protein n=1 Tax=Corticibacter populi TaxID=1550736 RepID=A0A3M6QML8_9BURK|nr:hypothetical protein [Corticibacter populi]RMX04195.1 hypothetical protein D8I35_15445 [Corticibacter populi]